MENNIINFLQCKINYLASIYQAVPPKVSAEDTFEYPCGTKISFSGGEKFIVKLREDGVEYFKKIDGQDLKRFKPSKDGRLECNTKRYEIIKRFLEDEGTKEEQIQALQNAIAFL